KRSLVSWRTRISSTDCWATSVGLILRSRLPDRGSVPGSRARIRCGGRAPCLQRRAGISVGVAETRDEHEAFEGIHAGQLFPEDLVAGLIRRIGDDDEEVAVDTGDDLAAAQRAEGAGQLIVPAPHR